MPRDKLALFSHPFPLRNRFENFALGSPRCFLVIMRQRKLDATEQKERGTSFRIRIPLTKKKNPTRGANH